MTDTTNTYSQRIKLANLGKLRELIAESHAKIVRAAKRANRPTPAAPEIIEGERTAERRCPKCRLAGEGIQCVHCVYGIEIVDGVTHKLAPNLITIDYVDVTVACERPRLAGWELLACVEPVPGTDQNLIARVPGSTDADLATYRTGALYCDHCQTKRNRSETFVVRNEDGEIKIVGRSCLADFLGGVSPAEVLARLEWVRILGECSGESGEFGGGRGRSTVHPADWCAQVAAVVRVKGWMSATRARAIRDAGGGTESTADLACKATFPMDFAPTIDPARAEFWSFVRSVEVTGEDVARAHAALSWAVTMDAADDYLHNLKTSASASYLEIGRATAILASIFAAWARATGRTLPGIEAPATTAKLDEYLASVGDKVRVAVVVEKVISLESQYGSTMLHLMRSTAGHRLTWNSSSTSLGEGWSGVLTGTVKRQEIYRNEHSTTLTRCDGEKGATMASAFEILPATKKRAKKPAAAKYGRSNQKCPGCGIDNYGYCAACLRGKSENVATAMRRDAATIEEFGTIPDQDCPGKVVG